MMTGRTTNNPSASTTSGDANQPIDLAQKSQTARVTDIVKGGGAAFVHFSSHQLIAAHPPSAIKTSSKIDSGTSVATVALVSRQPSGGGQNSSGALNLALPVSSGALGAGNAGLIRCATNPSSTSLTVVSASSTSAPVTVPSGYHIPRGAAVVANMTASRSQNLTSVVKTTSQVIGVNSSATITAPRTNLVGQRVVPFSSNNWINRSSTSSSVLTSKAAAPQGTGRATITTARPVQSPVVPVTTYHSATVKPGPIVTGNIRSPVSAGVRIGTVNDSLRSQTPKGLHITHPITHGGQKYIGAGVGGTIRGINAGTLLSPVSGTTYTAASSLVTSLASSGTTITPHPSTRHQTPQNAVRIPSASAAASSFSLGVTQSSSTVGGISVTPSGGPHHSVPRNQATDHHMTVKAPVVRGPCTVAPTQGLKGNQTSIPAGTQISFSASKVIGPPQGQTLTLAQLSNVASSKTGNMNTSQSGSYSVPFQPRNVATGSSSIGKIGGPSISMTKVIPQGKIAHSLGSPTGVSPASPVAGSNPSADSQPPHTNVFLHRAPHSAMQGSAAGLIVTQSDRAVTSIPQYSITTPYYIDSQNQSSVSVNAAIVPPTMAASHYMSTPVTTGAVRVGGTGVTSVVASSETLSHQGPTTTVIKPNSSPRPSILRKRNDVDGSPLKATKNLSAALSLPLSSPPSPKRPDSRGNGNISSGSTTVSANSSPGMQIIEEDSSLSISKSSVGIRASSMEESSVSPSCIIGIPVVTRSAESSVSYGNRDGKSIGFAHSSGHFPLNVPQTMDGVSPRKKPRKQQLMGNELHEVRPCDEEFSPSVIKKAEIRFSAAESDEEEKTATARSESPDIITTEPTVEASPPSPEHVPKRPHMSLINSYRQPWKSRHNHFARHSDVRPKEEKKRTVNEIANQKLTMQRVNGWKVVHISGQVADLVDMEGEVANRLRVLLKAIERRQQLRKPYKDFDKDVDRLSELVKANIQRSIIIKDQMSDAKTQMNKIFDHKDNIVEILNKYSTKRTLRRKEKI